MMSEVLAIIIVLLVLAGLFWLALAGFINGDRKGDALVKAVLRPSGQPGETRQVVVATVGNPARSPVLVGLAVRRAWLPAGGTARFAVPVTADSRRYLLTAVIGGADGRLRVHRLRLARVVDPGARNWHRGSAADRDSLSA